MVRLPLVRYLVNSSYLDVFGALLVLSVCVYRNFHGTIYFQGEIQFGIPLTELWSYVQKGAYPFGILSTLGAVFSLLVTRLVGRQNNTGNAIGVLTTVNSGTNDYLFGNASAILTYPITFFLGSFAFYRWFKGEKIRKRDKWYYTIILISIIVAFSLVYLGAYLFGGISTHFFLILVSVTFGLSLAANFCNALKYEETWLFWVVYNIIQLIKNFI